MYSCASHIPVKTVQFYPVLCSENLTMEPNHGSKSLKKNTLGNPPTSMPGSQQRMVKVKSRKSTYEKGSVLGGRILLYSPGSRSNSGPFSSMQFAELLSGLQRTHWYLAFRTGEPAQTWNPRGQ